MWTDRRARVSDGVELFVAGRPGHSPLLVIHGGRDWDHPYLRTPPHDLDRRVLLPDLLAALDALEVPRAHVLGFSTGGLIAQRLTLTAPHRVRWLEPRLGGRRPAPVRVPDAEAPSTSRVRGRGR